MATNNSTAGMFSMYSRRLIPYSTLMATGVVFNILSAAAMLHMRVPRTVHHLLLFNLAASDMLGSLLLWFYKVSPLLLPRVIPNDNPTKYCLFKLLGLAFPLIFSLFSTLFALLSLAAKQCVSICNPLFAATRLTKRVALTGILSLWITSIVISLTPAITVIFKNGPSCVQFVQSWSQRCIEICAYALSALVLLIIFLYLLIYREVIAYRRRIPELTQQPLRRQTGNLNRRDNRSETERNFKAFLTTALLTGVLFLFWLPYMTFFPCLTSSLILLFMVFV
ncbi:DgyrCDS12276 [Dimorphilus gyrociliatus]|uniref:DgyrCDS12276 n=1 Tax=Dimorphilus gyrociliatus TaxID=2664684 RepID=A0A7I8W7P7_9ANNE|nr:DgyrCDS12276 [Dimorphilus gyrociliatus]